MSGFPHLGKKINSVGGIAKGDLTRSGQSRRVLVRNLY
jgi:hypothetical protein